MDLFEKMEAALQAGDIDAVASFYHADFEMKMHSNGAVMTKEQWKAGAASILAIANLKENLHAVSTKMKTYLYLTQ